MLHRVGEVDSNKIYYNEHLKVSPRILESQLKIILRKYEPISIQDVPRRLLDPQSKPFVVFTMDDGYKDNLTEALPVFQKYNCPYTIFVATDFPDYQAILWWYELEDLLLKNSSITLSNGVTYPSETKEDKERSFLRIRQEILKLNPRSLKDGLNKLFESYNIDWESKVRNLSLTWAEIDSLKNHNLVTIGAHTQHHFNLTQLDSEESVCDEVIAGYQRLKEKTGIATNVFAYPFGGPNEAGPREFHALSSLSETFMLAVKAYGGPVRVSDDLFALPRLMLSDNTKTKYLLMKYKY